MAFQVCKATRLRGVWSFDPQVRHASPQGGRRDPQAL